MTDLFRTRDHVPDFDGYIASYKERSAHTRARLPCKLDVPYGNGADERLDLFFPAGRLNGAPVHLFVHGGYWRMFEKGDFSFVADTVTASGAIAAVIDYSLMPSARMETIVRQVYLAFHWLTINAERFGGDGARVSVSGHSAGAHLCALLLKDAHPIQPLSSLLISGIYDLAPLRHSFLQPELALTDREVQLFSPLRLPIRPQGRVVLAVGSRETEPFHVQARQLGSSINVRVTPIPDGDHMKVALDLGDPESVPGKALAAICLEQAQPGLCH